MKSFGIIFIVILLVFISASTGASGDGSGNGEGSGKGSGKGTGKNHVNIKTKADCDALEGICNEPKDCNLTQSIHIEPVSGGTCGGDEHDFCCIAKEYLCVQQGNGTFIPDAECNAKPGFTVTGLNLNGLNCCKPKDEDCDGNGGTAVTRMSSGAALLMIAVCAYRMF